MDEMNQALLHPVRMRIIQHLATQERLTTGEIVTLMPDVPKTSLYRHMNILTQARAVQVVDENRVRGTVEKIYSLNRTALEEENSHENATRNTFNFLMKIYADFATYFSDVNATPSTDKVFLNNFVLLLSDQEFDELLSQLAQLLTPYLNQEPTPERKPRNMSIVSAPSVD